MIDYMLERLKEPSTWRGLVMLMTGLGVSLSPELVAQIIAAGTAISGIIGILFKGK